MASSSFPAHPRIFVPFSVRSVWKLERICKQAPASLDDTSREGGNTTGQECGCLREPVCAMVWAGQAGDDVADQKPRPGRIAGSVIRRL